MFIVAKRSPISATAEHLSLVGPSAYNYLPVELLVYPRRPTARFVVVLKHFYSPSFILDHCIFTILFYCEAPPNVGWGHHTIWQMIN